MKIGSDNIGSLYLGDDKISKAYLGSDLVFANAAPVASYIENGLVLWLDCADATTSAWTDKIGNKTFNLYNVTKDNLGGVVFNGSSSYGKHSNSIFYDKSSCTIEAVVRSTSNKEGGVFCNTQGGLSFYYYSTNQVLNGASKSSGASKWQVDIAGLHVASLAGTTAYQDGTGPLTRSTADGFGGNDSGTYIGRRDINSNNNGIRGAFGGTIYQIRIYNRLLSPEEILYNQGIDIQKYGILTT